MLLLAAITAIVRNVCGWQPQPSGVRRRASGLALTTACGQGSVAYVVSMTVIISFYTALLTHALCAVRPALAELATLPAASVGSILPVFRRFQRAAFVRQTLPCAALA